jgi:glycosyltransferase involved in cell wall biosynthesis
MNRGDQSKRLDLLIRAFARVAYAIEDVSLVLVGDGNDRPRLDRIARDTGFAHRIRFVRGVSDNDLKILYRTCNFFSLPSAKEGFGLVFLEAMAAGKAVVAAASGAAPEIVVDRETGRIVPQNDMSSLAIVMKDLLDDPTQARRLGEAGRARLRGCFLYPRYAENVGAALDRLLSAGQRSAIVGLVP